MISGNQKITVKVQKSKVVKVNKGQRGLQGESTIEAQQAAAEANTYKVAAENHRNHVDSVKAAIDVIHTSVDQSKTNVETIETNLLDVQTNVQNMKAGVESIFDQFDDRYLGSKESDPTLDNDGNALIEGQIYWNSINNVLMFFNGATWDSPAGSIVQSASNARNSELLAEQWAEENENIEVTTGKFSAKHHAIKSEQSNQSVLSAKAVVDAAVIRTEEIKVAVDASEVAVKEMKEIVYPDLVNYPNTTNLIPNPLDPSLWSLDSSGTIINTTMTNPSGESFVGLVNITSSGNFIIVESPTVSMKSGESWYAAVIFKDITGGYEFSFQSVNTSGEIPNNEIVLNPDLTVKINDPDLEINVTPLSDGFSLIEMKYVAVTDIAINYQRIYVRNPIVGSQCYVQAAFFGKTGAFQGSVTYPGLTNYTPSPFDPSGWSGASDPDLNYTTVIEANPSGQTFVGEFEALVSTFCQINTLNYINSPPNGFYYTCFIIKEIAGIDLGVRVITRSTTTQLDNSYVNLSTLNTSTTAGAEFNNIDLGSGWKLIQIKLDIQSSEATLRSEIYLWDVNSSGTATGFPTVGDTVQCQAAFFGKANDWPALVNPKAVNQWPSLVEDDPVYFNLRNEILLANTESKAAQLGAENAQTAAATSASNAATSEQQITTVHLPAVQNIESNVDQMRTDVNNALVATNQAKDTAVAASGTATDASTSSENKLNEFKEMYWGSYTSEPTLSPLGSTPVNGNLYHNSTENQMFVYGTGSWQEIGSAIDGLRDIKYFTDVAGQDTFNVVYDPGFVDVFYNGSRLQGGVDFNDSTGTQIVLNSPVSKADDLICVTGYAKARYTQEVPVTGIRTESTFTNVAGQSSFVFTYYPGYTEVLLNGMRLINGVDYTADTGTGITLTQPVKSNNDYVQLVAYNLADPNLAEVTATGTTTSKTLADWMRSVIKSPNDSNIEIVAGVIRKDSIGTNTWSFLNNVDHAPVGILNPDIAVTAIGENLKINFNKTYKKVVSFICGPDETLTSKLNAKVGASVGLSNATISMSISAECSGVVRWNGSGGLEDLELGPFFVNANTTMSNGLAHTSIDALISPYVSKDDSISISPYSGSANIIPFMPCLKSYGHDSHDVNFIENYGSSLYTGGPSTNIGYLWNRSVCRPTILDGNEATAFESILASPSSNIWFFGIFEV